MGHRSIQPAGPADLRISVPPSKSFTNRALIAATLAEGESVIVNPSLSDDSRTMVSALRAFGAGITEASGTLRIRGTAGRPTVPTHPVDLGNTGTAFRFLTTFAVLAPGLTILTGNERMLSRPIGHLAEALTAVGIRCRTSNGFPPVSVEGGTFPGGKISVDGSASSQFITSILLPSPYASQPVLLSVTGEIRSRPYLAMTIGVMRDFGARVDERDGTTYLTDNTSRYRASSYTVEGDATSASYFLAAAAITGGRVVIENLPSCSVQGDVRFVGLLESMGCTASAGGDSITLTGGELHGIEIDMNDMPDCVQTLAVTAVFAKGQTVIRNIGHLRYKETDRIAALAAEIPKLGARVMVGSDTLVIEPGGKPAGGIIDTYDDHRMAMSFAVAGLRIPGITIANPACVSKSYPEFWTAFQQLEGISG